MKIEAIICQIKAIEARLLDPKRGYSLYEMEAISRELGAAKFAFSAATAKRKNREMPNKDQVLAQLYKRKSDGGDA